MRPPLGAPTPGGRCTTGCAEPIGAGAAALKPFSLNVRRISLNVTIVSWSVRRQPGRYGAFVMLGADDSFTPFLGEDLLVYLVLAMGAALVVGNVAAIMRPPAARGEGELEQAPVTRSLVMAGIGLIAALWALVSLFTS